MNEQVKVSLLLPSLNVADYIKECLESVLHQTLREIEILCIDAGSTDGTREVLEAYAKMDGRIHIIYTPVKSYGYQINVGIEQSKGEYIGIVETDDYIALDMYEKLYDLACRLDVDVAKGDSIWILENAHGQKWENERHMFQGSQTALYGKKLNLLEHLDLHSQDINVWNGIYRRKFLLNNKIRLNESKGAAYQDIGFGQQVLCRASSIAYMDDVVYHYRMSREGSSINDPAWLRFLCQEYRYLFLGDNAPCGKWGMHEKAVCKRFAEMFLGELRKTALVTSLSQDGWKAYYDFLQEQLEEVLARKILCRRDFSPAFWKELRLALGFLPAYLDMVRLEDKLRHEVLEELSLASQRVVIFGCGNWGQQLAGELVMHDFLVAAFCDNNPELQGTFYRGIPVLAPKEAVEQAGNAAWVIANKRNANAIRQQVLALGVAENSISEYIP